MTGDGTTRPPQTRERLLAAARERLLADGFARLSTRSVADAADVPLSQIHYHFGGKRGMVLALLARENEALLARQATMYAADEPLWQRYERACAFLDDDLASGYVRVLHEMIAAGWADDAVALEVRRLLDGWLAVLEAVAEEARRRFGTLGPFSPRQLGTLVGMAFLGGEQLILLGSAARGDEVRATLRALGTLIRELEAAVATDVAPQPVGRHTTASRRRATRSRS